MGEVAALAQVLSYVGVLKAIQEQVRFARARFDTSDISRKNRLDPLWDEITFHMSHPAFHILLNTTVSSRVISLTRELPLEMQVQFERGFERRAPALAPEQCRLSAMMSVQIFKAVLIQILQTDEDGRRRLVSELKAVLCRYLEPLLG